MYLHICVRTSCIKLLSFIFLLYHETFLFSLVLLFVTQGDKRKQLKNYEKYFLFYPISFFHSRGIQIFVLRSSLLLSPVVHC